ncbi:MAG TPA: hypothetical protein VIM75_14380 [Ohtaekwangia sp.]|uniref:hypothetical protein n=1 Tax=Ohtaekwangia sp. TaxID=2066019 RepID=UPI002F946E39
MIYSSEDFKRDIHQIGLKDFELKGVVQGWLFVRDQHDRSEIITLSYRDYASHSFYIDGVSVEIYFNEVESIFESAAKKIKPKGVYHNTTVQKSLVGAEGINYKALETEINSSSAFSTVRGEIELLIKNFALPFFEKYKTVQNVFEESEKMAIGQMASFIGQPLPFRRMIIKKLCHDLNYETYCKKFEEHLINTSSKDDLIFMKFLRELLETGLKSEE